MKKKYLLAVGSKFLITAIALSVLIAVNLFIFKTFNWVTISLIGVVLSVWNVVELKSEFQKIRETYTQHLADDKK